MDKNDMPIGFMKSYADLERELSASREEVGRLKCILEDHGPEGHNCTNQQFVDLRARLKEIEKMVRSVIDDRHITGADEYVVLSLTVEEYRAFSALSPKAKGEKNHE
jgi:hypothetical protein